MQQSKAKSTLVDPEKWQLLKELQELTPPKLVRTSKSLRDEQVGSEQKSEMPQEDEHDVLQKGGRGMRGRSVAVTLPPRVQTAHVVTGKRLFFANSAGVTDTAITTQGLLAINGCVGTVTNSKMQPIASSFRIRSVTIWPGPNSGSVESAMIFWNTLSTLFTKDDSPAAALPIGVSVTTAYTFRPPKGSLARMWMSSSVSTLFTISVDAGSVVEIDLDYTLSSQLVPGNLSVTTATVGSIYYAYLDAPASHLLQPIGLPTTF